MCVGSVCGFLFIGAWSIGVGLELGIVADVQILQILFMIFHHRSGLVDGIDHTHSWCYSLGGIFHLALGIFDHVKFLIGLGPRFVKGHMFPVLEKPHLLRMTLTFAAHHDHAFQFDIAGERDVPQKLFIGIGHDAICLIQTSIPRLEHELTGSIHGLVQARHLGQIDLLIETVLTAETIRILDGHAHIRTSVIPVTATSTCLETRPDKMGNYQSLNDENQ
ncbi:hypothetical protein TCAL_16306 [Tigriopus californicus]|uniref:Uncharacterized protein n=1 Tax=Tigriopus californicus TaxID=6832 RepID=A0A553N9K1_TIGCA|nr:hypothetical protein TCAL_16306 [Tigriopus californicus]